MKDPRDAICCRYCWQTLEWIYDEKKRDICEPCLEEIRFTNAEKVARRKKRDIPKSPPKK